ncbi:cbb3-type cytochrome oxidase assembly protein CcoS [Sinirhodobacter sp. WL0062]|uniref:Cbb3-type cytochrome oxidase assembly protein CcoS n=1 Tax=Rhodobacter flavimaris TaxID=2907145 RepID=A0ABS8YUY3_9RHOB|nr:cbb3-type cytochrome oxidase assembly protein CcoS [Sinirhodobacter sp. WL0062]MCE5973664.1 cbb3-type cytochrome oxidase assembly protein CcoS [Sinirhodobacter sp. WL0062]
MGVIAFLIPISLILGGLGLLAFFWSVKARQYEDPKGDSERILSDEFDDHPKG